jgi:hypothetical protein
MNSGIDAGLYLTYAGSGIGIMLGVACPGSCPCSPGGDIKSTLIPLVAFAALVRHLVRYGRRHCESRNWNISTGTSKLIGSGTDHDRYRGRWSRQWWPCLGGVSRSSSSRTAMLKKRKTAGVQEINAGSMADIAFLLAHLLPGDHDHGHRCRHPALAAA